MSKWDILARSDIKRYSLTGSLTHGEKITWIVCFRTQFIGYKIS